MESWPAPIGVEQRYDFMTRNSWLAQGELWQRLGYHRRRSRISSHTLAAVNHATQGWQQLVEPTGWWLVLPVVREAEFVFRLGKNLPLHGRVVRRALQDMDRAVLAVVTAGHPLDQELERRKRHSKLFEALILDAVGSVIAESLAEELHTFLARRAQIEGYRSGPRVSPGFGDWPVKDQERIIPLFAEAKKTVSLTTCAMMQPMKSVSFLTGFSPANSKPQT